MEDLAHRLEGLGGIRKVLRSTLEVLGRLLGGSWRPRRRTLRLSELVLAVNVVRLTSLGRLLEPTWEVSGGSWRSSRRSELIVVTVTERRGTLRAMESLPLAVQAKLNITLIGICWFYLCFYTFYYFFVTFEQPYCFNSYGWFCCLTGQAS